MSKSLNQSTTLVKKVSTFEAYQNFLGAAAAFRRGTEMFRYYEINEISVKIIDFFQFYIPFELPPLHIKKSPSSNFHKLCSKKFYTPLLIPKKSKNMTISQHLFQTVFLVYIYNIQAELNY